MKQLVNVLKTREMSNEGFYTTECCKERRERENDKSPHFNARYSITWPENIHAPLSEQFAQVVEIG